MEYILLIVSFILIIMGTAGSFLPALPGPPLAWLGLLTLHFTKGIEMNYWALGITLALTIVMVVLDYVIPAKGTKRFGGSKYGIWGTNIGLIVGLLAPVPGGFIIGPFMGAFIGEILFDQNDLKRAFKAATGSFIGFIASTFMKFVLCVGFLGWFIKIVWEYRTIWF